MRYNKERLSNALVKFIVIIKQVKTRKSKNKKRKKSTSTPTPQLLTIRALMHGAKRKGTCAGG